MKAVLFDLDGTLMNPNGSIKGLIEATLGKFGHPPIERPRIGLPLRDIFALRTSDATEIEAMMDEFRRASYEDTWRVATWYPGMEDVVTALRKEGMATAIVTTKGQREAETLMAKLDRHHLWDAIVGDDDVRPVKPDPAPVLEACRLLDVAPADAVMVGDTEFDVEAGRQAGCQTVGVSWGFGDVSQAHRRVDSASELLRTLLQR